MVALILTEESKVSLDECHIVAHIQLFCVQTLKRPKMAANMDFFVIHLFPCKPKDCLKPMVSVLNLLRCCHCREFFSLHQGACADCSLSFQVCVPLLVEYFVQLGALSMEKTWSVWSKPRGGPKE